MDNVYMREFDKATDLDQFNEDEEIVESETIISTITIVPDSTEIEIKGENKMATNLNDLYEERERLENVIGSKVDGNGDGWGQYAYLESDREQAKKELKELELKIEELENNEYKTVESAITEAPVCTTVVVTEATQEVITTEPIGTNNQEINKTLNKDLTITNQGNSVTDFENTGILNSDVTLTQTKKSLEQIQHLSITGITQESSNDLIKENNYY